MNIYGKPVLGQPAPDSPYGEETVIAWGHVDATVGGVEWERWCILTLLSPRVRIPNVANYAVYYFYPGHIIPAGSSRIEARATFPNIVPAVEAYRQWGMDW